MSADSSKNSVLGLENNTEREHLNASYNNSLLARVSKAQEAIKKSNSNTDIPRDFSKFKSTPKDYHQKAGKIFATPEVTKEFKFKTPNSGNAALSGSRTGGYRSGNHFGTKTSNNGGQWSVPSYQRETAASTLKKSPTKVRNILSYAPKPFIPSVFQSVTIDICN